MQNDEQPQFDPNANPIRYVAWYYSDNRTAPLRTNARGYYVGGDISAKAPEPLRTASTLRQLAEILMDLSDKLQLSSKDNPFLRKISSLEIVAYFEDGREFSVPHTLYTHESKKGLRWRELNDIRQHFPIAFDLQRIADIVASDMESTFGAADFDTSFEEDYFEAEQEETEEELFDDAEDLPALVEPEPIPEPEVENIIDARERVAASVVRRRGQPEFRKALIQAYNSECAITGCNAVEALEAAHISPYRGPNTNHPSNGLLLRADLHTLFDLGLIAVDTKTMTVVIAESLIDTTYAEINGQLLRLPAKGAFRPNLRALDKHRSESKVG